LLRPQPLPPRSSRDLGQRRPAQLQHHCIPAAERSPEFYSHHPRLPAGWFDSSADTYTGRRDRIDDSDWLELCIFAVSSQSTTVGFSPEVRQTGKLYLVPSEVKDGRTGILLPDLGMNGLETGSPVPSGGPRRSHWTMENTGDVKESGRRYRVFSVCSERFSDGSTLSIGDHDGNSSRDAVGIDNRIGRLMFVQDYGTCIYIHTGSLFPRDHFFRSGHPSSVGTSFSPPVYTSGGATALRH
jgi:hypothetical protein